MATIESGIPLPAAPAAKAAAKRPLGALSQEIYDTLGGCNVGDSFVVAADYKKAALVGGRMAKRLGFGIRAAPEGEGARLWRVEPKPAKVKAAAAE